MNKAQAFATVIVASMFAAAPFAANGQSDYGQTDYRLPRGQNSTASAASDYGQNFQNNYGSVPTAPPINSNFSAPPAAPMQSGWVDAFTTPANPSPNFKQEATTVRIKPKQDRPLDGGITARDLHLLGQHDVAVIVDRSLSMTTSDCPGVSSGGGWQRALGGLLSPQLGGINISSMSGMSRWEFVQTQTFALARQTEQIFPRGIMLVLFSSHPRVFNNVDLRQMPSIFAQNGPWGSTHTEEALEAPISDYFQRRNASGGKVKPLVIAVITDGMPTRPEALRDLIIDTTRQMRNPNEIRITFLQIGTERKGFRQLNELDRELIQEGAKFDIVSTKTFPEVVQQGLAKALIDAIEKGGPG